VYAQRVAVSPEVRIRVVEPPRATYRLSLGADRTAVAVGEPVRFYGRLTRDGAGVPGATVELQINGRAVGRTRTASDGSYSFTHRFTAPGTYVARTVAYVPVPEVRVERRPVSPVPGAPITIPGRIVWAKPELVRVYSPEIGVVVEGGGAAAQPAQPGFPWEVAAGLLVVAASLLWRG